MLLEREIKTFVKNNYIPIVLKQIPPNFDGSIGQLSISIKLDLTKTLRQNNQIGIFIIGNYPRFTELVQESILEVMQDNKISLPEFGTNISYTINNCPLPRHNLESIEFLSAAFQQQNGVMIFLKDVHILQIGQPELYLFSWVQVWTTFCNCSSEKKMIKKKQTLIDIVKNKSQNLKEVVIKEVPRCSHCASKLKNVGVQNKIYNNCQKMRVSVNMKGDNVKEEMFQRGELQIFIDQSNTSKLNEGDIIDICGYYSVEPRITKILGDQIIVRSESGLFLVCYFPSSTFTSNNNLFFSRLTSLNCEYIKCDDPRDEETICYNYKNLLKTVNSVKFPYLNQNNFSSLKLVIINCLFNQLHCLPIHIMIITDEVSLLEKAVRLNGVVIKKWPTLYDNHSLLIFLSSCHNCILMVTNPTKKDFQYISGILNQKMLSKVNFTFWIITEPSKDLRGEQAVEKINVVMDLSMEKNQYICKSVYDDMIDQKLESFIRQSDDIEVTVPKGFERVKVQPFHNIEEVFEGIESSEEERMKEHNLAQRILQKYFLRAREYKHINSNSLENIKALTEGFSYFRNFMREKGKLNMKKPFVNILDAILAIFIEEETSRNKYSSSNTLFSNEISKLMLNEGECELSFWDYEVDENSEIGEAKRYLKKDDMFKRVVCKLMTLLYSNEIS